jgi:hypothetical protein
MTITTGAFKDGGDLWSHLSVRKDGMRFVDQWVRPRRADELNAEKNNDQDNSDPFQDSKYYFHVCCLCRRCLRLRNSFSLWERLGERD